MRMWRVDSHKFASAAHIRWFRRAHDFFTNSRNRSSPRNSAASCASKSPLRSSGVRVLRIISCQTARLRAPFSTNKSGEIIKPSW